ncbi:MAG: carboxyl transferase domain-containing protein [Bacilli bacterium]|nr:carboxyl transferase domain-containing protein [Bacilli bacterium]
MIELENKKQEINKRTSECLCPKCGQEISSDFFVCKSCNYHYKINATDRIKLIADENSFIPFELKETNYLKYKEEYDKDKAVITGTCSINDEKVVIAVMDSYFMLGTLSVYVGEKITKCIEYATTKKLPLLIFSASGGVRVEDGMLGLVQMAKITAALDKHLKTSLLYLSILTNPTLGGVSASFALIGDINIAEPNSIIGFAGKKVIESIINEELDDDFQTTEYNLKNGMIDIVIDRYNQKNCISKILKLHKQPKKKIEKTETKIKHQIKEKDSTEILTNVRDLNRYKGKDFLLNMFPDFIELHGDRLSNDDPSIIGGITSIDGTTVTVIIQNKGRNLEENLESNFGMTSPEGYRKVTRLIEQAEKFNRPIINFIDSPGAHPGKHAEDNGQSIAIAECMKKFINIKVPVLSFVIGEGCSGGALALSISDYIGMLENAMYCVISPEAYCSIKKKEVNKELLQEMRYTSVDLLNMGFIDEIISEDNKVFQNVRNIIINKLSEYIDIPERGLLLNRYNKIRNWDKFVRGDVE